MKKVYISAISCDYCRQHLNKKHKGYAKYKAQNILVLKFLKESTSENHCYATWDNLCFILFIIDHNILIANTGHTGPLFQAMTPQKIPFCLNKNNFCNKIDGTFYTEWDYGYS